MRVEIMRKKHPREFANIKRGVYDDIRLQKKISGVAIPEKFARVVAYNAAFFGIVEFEKISSRKKNIVAGKTSNNSHYATALALMNAFQTETGHEWNEGMIMGQFQLWCRERLNNRGKAEGVS